MSVPCAICCQELGCCKGKTCTNFAKAWLGQSDSTFCNLCLAPFALTAHYLFAYVFSCVGIYLSRLFNHACCYACVYKNACAGCYKYTDSKFPASAASIGTEPTPTPPKEGEGDLEQGNAAAGTGTVTEEIVWKRVTEIFHTRLPVLFKDDAHPDDVVQGIVGNCWLVSALACMAEFPSLVDKIFTSREFSHRGKYKVRLYNDGKKEWETVTVDDYLPLVKSPGHKAGDLDGYRFKYAEPQGREIWVPILEKAFAKFRGSYRALDGGNAVYAFRCLTGDFVFRYQKDEATGTYTRKDLAHQDPKELAAFRVHDTDFTHDKAKMFATLQTYDREQGLMAASVAVADEGKQGKGTEEVDEKTGLIKGHSYALLEVKRVGKGLLGAVSSSKEFELVKLRNPWGKFEWTGDWSDNSDMWEKYPKVKKALRPEAKDDGSFWMAWDDFFTHFDHIDLCDRTVNYQDYHLDVHEDPERGCKHIVGPAQGCLEGTASFWCLCEGPRHLYFGNKTKYKPKRGKLNARDDGLF